MSTPSDRCRENLSTARILFEHLTHQLLYELRERPQDGHGPQGNAQTTQAAGKECVRLVL